MRKRLAGPRILEARKDINSAESCFRVSSRSKAVAPFFFLAVRRVINFDTVIQATYNFVRIHGVMDHGRVQIFHPLGAESINVRHDLFRELLDFSKPLATVPELEAVLYRAARLGVWIPSMLGPKPHTEPTRNKLVGTALYGPAMVHCEAWASSSRVA